MSTRKRIGLFLRAFRVNQWIKNLVIFTAIIFSGELFNPVAFLQSLYAFVTFCLLSSTSYVLNDIIDFPYDRKHPLKKDRPIASGAVSIQEATFLVFVLSLISLIISLFFSIKFFFLALLFILLHFFYSLYLKKFPVVDIFSISISFMIRAFAGEVATNFHIPIWLTFTIFFGSLFIATVKRHAEYVVHGGETRKSLLFYKEHLLDFLTTTFATSTIIAYSFYTYFERPALGSGAPISRAFTQYFPSFEARRWLMITIPFVVYGIARYAQLLYEREEGERPENIITKDRPLIASMLLWGATVILLLYIL